jgi:hypothetical protein
MATYAGATFVLGVMLWAVVSFLRAEDMWPF